MSNSEKIKELIKKLNEARYAYYNNSVSIISDYDYDCMFDELQRLEEETGIIMSNSPTQTVGYEVKSKLDKITHSHPMLSLDKTKSVDDLMDFVDDKDCLLSLKMDGLTALITYENGVLIQMETRGNGTEGELVTHNAPMITNIPLHINYKEHFEIEGEVIISYDDFEKINKPLQKDEKYANPRNLASGSLRQLDSNVASKRHMKFIAWKVPTNVGNTMHNRFSMAENFGFTIVPYVELCNTDTKEDVASYIHFLKHRAEGLQYPIDGLVISYNDINYGQSLGMTGHHPRHSLAYKFYDEEVETILKTVEWTMGKTGSLCPTAVFEPVELDGTVVERASLHNVSIMKKLELSYGDTVTVYKANQIIPQIRDNLDRSLTDVCIPPTKCPICGEDTKIVKEKDTEVLICTNPNCKGKLLGKLSHAVSKNALNIDGLSESTLEKFINLGWLACIKDIYHLTDYVDEMIQLEGFGIKSVTKLFNSIDDSRNTTVDRFLYAQSIPLIGRTASKDIAKLCPDIWDFIRIMQMEQKDYFMRIDGFGMEMNRSLRTWWKEHMEELLNLIEEFKFKTTNNKNSLKATSDMLKDKIFVITGKLVHFKNRDELIKTIESYGGKVAGSVTKKTDYLINNDTESNSSKNKKAKELGVKIISEGDFKKLIN